MTTIVLEELYHELNEAVMSARLLRPILEAHDRNCCRIEREIQKLRQGQAVEA